MKVTVAPSHLSGTVDAIPSKSHVHRLLIAAAIADAPCTVECPYLSEDTEATARCLNALGAKVNFNGNGFDVTPVSRDGKAISKPDDTVVLDCGESGSTLRFLLPVACALGINARFTGKGRLPERPLGGLKETLQSAGIKFSSDRLPFTVSGKLSGNMFKVPADVSSQYVSGMLFALAALESPCTLVTSGKAVSSGYTEMTVDTLRTFGADINEENGVYRFGGGRLHSPQTVCVEGDWSNAAFMIAAGVLGGDVSVRGLNRDSKQKDKAVFDLLADCGADVTFQDGVCRARKSAFSAIKADLTDIPDLAPVLSVLAAVADGESVFTGVSRLRAKESDRLTAIIENLSSMGIRTELRSDDELAIFGGNLKPFCARSFGDHRMVMSAAVAALVCGGEIDDGAPISKSYPDFFKELESLGGKINETV